MYAGQAPTINEKAAFSFIDFPVTCVFNGFVLIVDQTLVGKIDRQSTEKQNKTFQESSLKLRPDHLEIVSIEYIKTKSTVYI